MTRRDIYTKFAVVGVVRGFSDTLWSPSRGPGYSDSAMVFWLVGFVEPTLKLSLDFPYCADGKKGEYTVGRKP